jgi:Na+/melibiose symporter-like transporter
LRFSETEFELSTGKRSRNFWLGNAVLVLAMLMMFFMGPLSDALGIWAAVLWMVMAALGMGLIMSDKSDDPPAPD